MFPVVPDPADAWKMIVVKYACCGSVSFSLYEMFITLDDERRWIWKMPRWSYTRCLYHFSKYFGLAVQIVNTVGAFVLHSRYPLAHHTCRAWWMYRFTTAQMMLVCLELILMARVHILYGYNRLVLGFLALLLVGEVVVISIAVGTLRHHVDFSPACLITRTPPLTAYFGSGAMIVLVFILIFTLLPAAVPKRWKGRPLLPVMIRDGVVVFFIMATLLVASMVHKIFRYEGGSIVFLGFISIASSAGCRMIINLRDVVARGARGHSAESDADSDFQLSTSIFEARPSNDVKAAE